MFLRLEYKPRVSEWYLIFTPVRFVNSIGVILTNENIVTISILDIDNAEQKWHQHSAPPLNISYVMVYQRIFNST